MAKHQIQNYKKKIILSGLFFFAIWLLLSNNSIFKVKYDLFPNTPRFEANLSFDFLIVLGIIFPFLFLIGMNLLIFFHYSNHITMIRVRRLLKMIILLMILFLFYITFSVGPKPWEDPLATNSTSSAISSTFDITSTPIVTITTIIPSSSTLPQSSTMNPSSINLFHDLDVLINFLSQNMIFIMILIAIIFVAINNIRPIEPSEKKRFKKLIHSDSNIRKIYDKPRKHIITSYLYASKILEKLGANDDFSLTPIEFQNEIKNKFSNEENYWAQFPKLTYWYEVARFSNEEIPEKAVKEVDEALKRLNNIVDKFFDINTISEKEND